MLPEVQTRNSKLKISAHAERLFQSEIRAMTIECEKVKGINLSQGISDTGIPIIVGKGAQDAIDAGLNSYTRYDGLKELRHAIAQKSKSYNGISADAESEIVVTVGTTGAFYCACLALLNPGDEVILFEPYYGYHLHTLLLVGVIPTFVRLNPPDWKFSREDLEKIITPKTKGILINTPNNPCGKVFSREELMLLVDFANRHDLVIFTDEVYEYFIYDGREHVTPASLPGAEERTVTISGFSKTFSITGWRIGYAICKPEWAQKIGYLNDLVYVCAPAPLQKGVAHGLDELQNDFYTTIQTKFTALRDKVCNALAQAKLTASVPEGAYYVLADITSLPGKTSKEKAMSLLSKTGVASVPDSAFFRFPLERNYARFCFAKKDFELDEACRRLERFNI